MDRNTQDYLKSINGAILTPIVREAIGEQRAVLIDYNYWQLHGGFEVNTSIYRFTGSARLQERIIPWSLILKVLHPHTQEDPTHWNYLKREQTIYKSGLLKKLPPGLSAPACFCIEEFPNGECWLWLEEVKDVGDSHWPLNRYGVVARHFGRLNGVYLLFRPLPTYPWFTRRWLRSLIEQATPQITLLPQVINHPLVRRLFPEDVLEGLFHLWTERGIYLAVLDDMPQTFCHRDAFRRNLFARPSKDGGHETVAVDWVFAGTGALGEELVALVVATIGFREVAFEQWDRLESIVFAEYLAELQRLGWRGDSRLIRCSYILSAALRYVIGGTGNLLPILIDDSRHSWFMQMWGDSVGIYVDYWAQMFRRLLALVHEGRQLLSELGLLSGERAAHIAMLSGLETHSEDMR